VKVVEEGESGSGGSSGGDGGDGCVECSVSGPVVVAEHMIGCAMYELVGSPSSDIVENPRFRSHNGISLCGMGRHGGGEGS
jgi:hypothetical protein